MATLGRMNIFLTSYFAKVAHLLPTISDKPLAECTIAFIPTAAAVEDVDFYVAEARQALADLSATIREVDIASADAASIAAAIDAADCIYVSGGTPSTCSNSCGTVVRALLSSKRCAREPHILGSRQAAQLLLMIVHIFARWRIPNPLIFIP